MAERPPQRLLLVAAGIACAAGALSTVAPVLGIGLLFAMAAVILGCAIAFLLVAASHARLSHRLRRASRRAVVNGTQVRVAPLSGAAFVAGLVEPQIYLDESLLQSLRPRELDAVVLHERAHQIAGDPIRLALLAACAPLATVLPPVRRLLQLAAVRREVAADRYAVESGATPAALASALLRVPTGLHGVPGFSSAIDVRLGALLGHEQVQAAPIPHGRTALIALTTFAVCLVTVNQASAIAALLHGCCP